MRTNRKGNAANIPLNKTSIAGGGQSIFDFDNAIKKAEKQFCPNCNPACRSLPAAMLCAGCAKSAQKNVEPAHVVKSSETAEVRIVNKPKVVKCFRCFGCEKSFAPPKMSAVLGLCRTCFHLAQTKGERGRSNFIDRAVNNFHKFLRFGVAR